MRTDIPILVTEMKMAQLTKILIPIDFSPESGQALRDAAALARETWSQLIALHVFYVGGRSLLGPNKRFDAVECSRRSSLVGLDRLSSPEAAAAFLITAYA